MATSTGFVLAAGGIAMANDAVFAPLADNQKININWRIIPATAVLAIAIAGLEKIAPAFGKGLGALVLLSVLIIPYGNAPSPISNITKVLGY
jgi:hypothetical protein